MNFPKFVIGDNTNFPEDIFIIHLEFPQFIINLINDEIELFDDVEDLSESELQNEIQQLVKAANEFYDSEIKKYEALG